MPRCLFLVVALFLASVTTARAEMAYVYSAIGKNKEKQNLVSDILREALQRTEAKYGAYAIRMIDFLPRARQVHDLKLGSGELTFAVLGTGDNQAAGLRPIRIPVDKGLIGYRILLIRDGDQARFDEVRNVEDLRRFTFGQMPRWDDVRILRANGLTVETGSDFDGLFPMLFHKRFDAFPRGCAEILREVNEKKELWPDLRVEKSLLIYYPLPVYFWFSGNGQGAALSARLEEGMRAMIEDGSYDVILWKYYRPLLEGLGLGHRRVIRLSNPFLPSSTPLRDGRLWADPTRVAPE